MGMKQLSDYIAYNDTYQFIASTKYRKNLFLDEKIRRRLGEIIQEIITKKANAEFVECTAAYNNIHVLVKSKLSFSQVGQSLFGASREYYVKSFQV